MTEAEWSSSPHPRQMLESLQGQVTPRKLRLLACALIRSVPLHRDGRSVWEVVPAFEWFRDPIPGGRVLTCHELVEIAERKADGNASADDWDAATAFARAVHIRADADAFEHDPTLGPGIHYRGSAFRLAAAQALNNAVEEDVVKLGRTMLDYQSLKSPCDNRSREVIHPDIHTPTRELIREVFGNPLRPVEPEGGWLSPSVIALATQIYEHRDYVRMPRLADALEAAGCRRADILAHCRGPIGHARGCWVLDALRDAVRRA